MSRELLIVLARPRSAAPLAPTEAVASAEALKAEGAVGGGSWFRVVGSQPPDANEAPFNVVGMFELGPGAGDPEPSDLRAKSLRSALRAAWPGSLDFDSASMFLAEAITPEPLDDPLNDAKLLALTKPVTGREDDYHNWYTNIHMRDVVSVDGVRTAQRFAITTSLNDSAAPYHSHVAVYDLIGGMIGQIQATITRHEGRSNPGPGTWKLSGGASDPAYVATYLERLRP